MIPESLADLSPAASRQLLDAAAARRLSPFLARIHPVAAPEAPFIDALHLRAIAYAAEQVVQGKIRRLAIAVPPRHFKSSVTSIALPAWALGQDPSTRVVCVSYGSDLSRPFAERSRAVMQSDLYRRIFPQVKLRSKNPPLDRLQTTVGGYRLATSVGGILTGIGADLAIVDDPMKASDAQSLTEREKVHEWFKGSLMSRFDKPSDSRIIVVMQRLHQDDLIGRLLEDEGWSYLKLPGEAQQRIRVQVSDDTEWELKPGQLLFPQRFDAAALQQLRLDLGESAFNAQILQAPAPAGGALIKLKWFRRYHTLPPAHRIERVIQVWDTALADSTTADYSACTTWAISGKDLYLKDCFRRQMPYHALEKVVLSHREKHGAGLVFVEKAGTGIALFQNLHQLQGHSWLIQIPAEGSKINRIAQQVPKIERGRVLLPISAPWLEAFEHEVGEFPYGRHDDQVDSMAYFLRIFDYGRTPRLRDLSMFAGGRPGEPVL